MKYVIFYLLFWFSSVLIAQEIVKLPNDPQPDGVSWDRAESSYFNNIWQTQTVANVSNPSMEVFRPRDENNTGVSVVICPGGGMYLLSIESEGNLVAKWLADRGVTAFVLKYRLVPTGDNGAIDLNTDGPLVEKKARKLLSFAHLDALNAISHIRKNAEEYNIDPEKIGLIGFSAGGAVTMEATYKSNEGNRPNFIGPIYAWMNIVDPQKAPAYQPPAFIVCATDDPLLLAPGSVTIYSDWIKVGASAALHMYSKGGHGFGMKEQGLPSDNWIERFADWMKAQEIISNVEN